MLVNYEDIIYKCYPDQGNYTRKEIHKVLFDKGKLFLAVEIIISI